MSDDMKDFLRYTGVLLLILVCFALMGCAATTIKEGAETVVRENSYRLDSVMAARKDGPNPGFKLILKDGSKLTLEGPVELVGNFVEPLSSVLLALGGAKSPLADIDDVTTPTMQATIVPYAFSAGVALVGQWISYLNNKEAWSVVSNVSTQAVSAPQTYVDSFLSAPAFQPTQQ